MYHYLLGIVSKYSILEFLYLLFSKLHVDMYSDETETPVALKKSVSLLKWPNF